MKRYGLVRLPSGIWKHPGGKFWVVPLLGDNDKSVRGYWEVVEDEEGRGPTIGGTLPMNLRECAQVIHDKLKGDA